MPAIWLSDWAQEISAIGSLLSGLGLIGVLGSFIFLIKQTHAVQNTSVATAYQGIISAGTTVNNLYLQYPDLMPLLRNVDPLADGEEWEPGHDDPRLVMIAAQTLDYFELILVTMTAFPRRLQDEWRDYIVGQFRRQRYLYRVVVRTDWYTEELRELARASKQPTT